jgi:hypothetical protein
MADRLFYVQVAAAEGIGGPHEGFHPFGWHTVYLGILRIDRI